MTNEPKFKTIIEAFCDFVAHYYDTSLEELRATDPNRFVALRDTFYSGVTVGFNMREEIGDDVEAKDAILAEIKEYVEVLEMERAALQLASLIFDKPKGHA